MPKGEEGAYGPHDRRRDDERDSPGAVRRTASRGEQALQRVEAAEERGGIGEAAA